MNSKISPIEDVYLLEPKQNTNIDSLTEEQLEQITIRNSESEENDMIYEKDPDYHSPTS